MQRHDILAPLLSLLLFFLVFLGLNFPFLLSLIIGVLGYGASYYLLKPAPKYLNFEELNEQDAIELENLFKRAQGNIVAIEEGADYIQDSRIRAKSKELAKIGQTILVYLEDRPKLMSGKRHFLDYYPETARRIIQQYHEIELGKVSEEKFKDIRSQTLESIEYLIIVFKNQNDSLHQSTVTQLTLENELLEETLQLSEEEVKRIHEE